MSARNLLELKGASRCFFIFFADSEKIEQCKNSRRYLLHVEKISDLLLGNFLALCLVKFGSLCYVLGTYSRYNVSISKNSRLVKRSYTE